MTNHLECNRKICSPCVAGVFPHLVNQSAMIDKVVVGIWGIRRKRLGEQLEVQGNYAIGGPGRFYGRCVGGRHSLSGNNFQFRYGLMRPYNNLSPFVLTMWAGKSSLSCADVLLTSNGFMRRGYAKVISSVEFTFDVHGISVWRLARDICTRARLMREISDKQGLATLYVGGASSPWQMRIYRKMPMISRVEFILRRTFLRALGIDEPHQLYLLKTANIWRHLWFSEVDYTKGDLLPSRIREVWVKRGFCLPPILPASVFARVLREAHVDPSPWLVRSECEVLLRKMQEHFVW